MDLSVAGLTSELIREIVSAAAGNPVVAFGSHVDTARLQAARDAGCRWCVVETAADTPEKPNHSTHNLRRMGFRDAYERPNWVKVLEAAPLNA